MTISKYFYVNINFKEGEEKQASKERDKWMKRGYQLTTMREGEDDGDLICIQLLKITP